jgi:hypothetical protein
VTFGYSIFYTIINEPNTTNPYKEHPRSSKKSKQLRRSMSVVVISCHRGKTRLPFPTSRHALRSLHCPTREAALFGITRIYNAGTKSFRESVRLKTTHASRSCEAKIATTIRHNLDDNTQFFCEISLDRHTPHHPMQWPKYSYICTQFLFYIKYLHNENALHMRLLSIFVGGGAPPK